ncbi:hypothetical protein T265_09641 [Opisthorchis viverrini]|uniref:Uncharacterized protein n=1 Tax=Opisthorchis viverrini TaxID=6198 RepID=A0A075A4A5_OPIVI|nr:hypothetical protein T265_09641 [Opisthorchis viverrini]KER22219.1 hypothetical protein T265_09641 [Opisthorchis viverrini]
MVRTRPPPLDSSCLGLGDLTVSQPSCNLQVACCSTLSVPSCHVTRRLHEGWDTARSPKPRQRTREAQVGFETTGFRNKLAFEKYTNLQINLVLTRESTESLVYDIIQLNALHTGCLMIQLARYSRYRTTHKVVENSSTAHGRLTGTRGLRLPDEPETEGRNQSCWDTLHQSLEIRVNPVRLSNSKSRDRSLAEAN